MEDVLRIVALTDRADGVVEKFSGGMKRRVNIAAGLVHQPRLLFLDEPTVGVDPQSRNQIFESVLRLNRERGMTIIYTSHYMEEVEHLCSRVAIIDGGRIIAMDTIKNLINMLGGGVIYVGVPRVDEALLQQMAALPAVQEATSGATGAGSAACARAGSQRPKTTARRGRDDQDRGGAQPAGRAERDQLPQRARPRSHLAGDPGAQPGERLPAPDRQEVAGVGP